MGYGRSPIRDLESYLRIVVALDEDDIQLISSQYNPNFDSYKITPGLYSIKNISDVACAMGNNEGTLKTKYDDFSMETKLILIRFGGNFGTLRFDEKSFYNTLLRLTLYWDYKPNNAVHADSPGVYTSDKNLNLSTIDKIHLKCDVFDGSVVNGRREPILFSFVLNKPAGNVIRFVINLKQFIIKK